MSIRYFSIFNEFDAQQSLHTIFKHKLLYAADDLQHPRKTRLVTLQGLCNFQGTDVTLSNSFNPTQYSPT